MCTKVCIRKSLALFTPRYHAMCEQFGIPEAERPTFGVRRMKSRWGHYKVTKQYGFARLLGIRRARILSHSITLSTRLSHTPLNCIDMVIAHELCHIRYRSHGPRFKAYLAEMYPQIKVAEKDLKAAAKEIF